VIDMSEMGDWLPLGGEVTGRISEDRRRYVDYLHVVHDEATLRLALVDEIDASPAEIVRMIFEAEMLANYGVF